MGAMEAALIALTTFAVLSFGGVYPWGYTTIAIGASALAVWMALSTRAWTSRRFLIAAALLLVVVLTILAQAIALPLDLFEQLSPAGAAVLRSVDLRYLLSPPTHHALSLAPDTTLHVAGFAAAMALLFASLMIAAPRLSLDRFVTWLALLGIALAVFGVVQKAMNVRSADLDGWQLVYGFWKPKRAGDVFGPFINRNHFAGWMIMVLPLVLGYACAVAETTGPRGRLSAGRGLRWTATPDGSRFMTLGAAALVMATSVVATGSRSGMTALGVMLLVFGYFVAVRIGPRRARTLALGGLVAVLLGGVLWLGIGRTVQRFSLASGDVGSRVSAWQDSLRIIRDMPVFGTGVGGFGTAMLVYQREHRETFYAQAHNDYLQILAEGGLLVALPVFTAVVLLVWTIRLRLRQGDGSVRVHWIRAGAVAGLVAIATQSLVEFSLQIPANTLVFIVLAAIAVHRPARPRVSHADRV